MDKLNKEKQRKPVGTGKALLFALMLGVVLFLDSLLFIPLGRVADWNVILLFLLSAGTLLCFYKSLKVDSPGKGVVWGAFTGLVTWTLVGQLLPFDRTPHTSFFARPFSELHLYSFEALPYLIFFVFCLELEHEKEQILFLSLFLKNHTLVVLLT